MQSGSSLAGSISAQRRERAARREASRTAGTPPDSPLGVDARLPRTHTPAAETAPDANASPANDASDAPTAAPAPAAPLSAAAALRAFEAARREQRQREADSSTSCCATTTTSTSATSTSATSAQAAPIRAPAAVTPPAATEQQRCLFEEAAARHAAAAARRDQAIGEASRGGAAIGQPAAVRSLPTSYADAARALQMLLDAAAEAAADAAAAEAAAEAAAAEKAALIEGAGPAARGKRGASLATRWAQRLSFNNLFSGAATSSAVHPRLECPICLELLGTEDGEVQALGCMDAFCRSCIATHLDVQAEAGRELCCPICKRVVPPEEHLECGQGRPLPAEQPHVDSVPHTASSAGSAHGNTHASLRQAARPAAHAGAPSRALVGSRIADPDEPQRRQPPQQPQSQPPARRPAAPRESITRRITTAAVTAAAVITHAPALLRSSPEHLAAAAHALSRGRRGAEDDDSEEEDLDGDMVFLGDGTVVRFLDQLDQM